MFSRRVENKRAACALAAIAVAAVAPFAGCTVTPLDPSLAALALTPEPPDTYGIEVSSGVTKASAAASNTNHNSRVVFWPKDDAESVDQQSCATWSNATHEVHQEGAALRVHSSEGRTRAITVTKNVWDNAYWLFNVHLWDTQITAGPPATHIAAFDLAPVFLPQGALVPFPWRLCARAVGDVISFVAWPAGQPQPAWSDPHYGGSVSLPPGWGEAGHAGWYVGHLAPGGSVLFSELSTAPVASDLASEGRHPSARSPVAPAQLPALP